VRPGEAELIDGFLTGEKTAFSTIDGWVQQAAWPFRRRLGDRWEDLLQDVRLETMRLLQNQRFRGESSLKTYLWRVTNNACVDKVRAQSRVQWEEIEQVDQRGEEPQRLAFADAFRGETKDLLLRVLAEMPDECKELWRLIFEGYSYREMSSDLGVSEGALRVRVLRCRRRAVALRDELVETS
jgi:RNA polymerase sigma-70 factor (ECF subfamily)